MFSLSSALTKRSTSIFQQLSLTNSFLVSVSKRQEQYIDFPESRKRRVEGIPQLIKRLFCSTNTGNDSDKSCFRFPPLTGNILVIGNGDFSYSVALAKENKALGDAMIFASSLDTKEIIEG